MFFDIGDVFWLEVQYGDIPNSIIKRTDYIGRLSETDLQYLIRQIEIRHK
jgi:hypothetical protein